ncbi:MAG TPA: hypothetical protein VGW40_04345 [Allosphingosinicella sp.]|nr:hypothetical protein [Allosphingosinicella sp.]
MRFDEILVGLVALALVPLIGWRIVRGLRDGRLPIYRTYLDRADGRARFAVLLGLHGLSLVLVAVVAADLLFGLRLRDAL